MFSDLGVTLLLGYAFGLYNSGLAHHHLYGDHRNGGHFINLYSRNSDSDMAYNREFQRNRYLSEDPTTTKDYLNSAEQLRRLGIVS